LAGDATRAYAPRKLEHFTRQIVYLRPDTFIIFDRVKSKQTEFKKTWLLQAMRKPAQAGDHLVITNGKGRLFVQTLLPQAADVRLVSGPDLYRVGDQTYPPRRQTGAAPECRVEVSPPKPALEDFFLHVLTTAEAETTSVPAANVRVQDQRVRVEVAGAQVEFRTDAVGGQLMVNGKKSTLADQERP
jgi:hypothetical protein